jgi:hypothetical protein
MFSFNDFTDYQDEAANDMTVNYDQMSSNSIISDIKSPKYDIAFSKYTTETYRVLRLRKMDPITLQDLDEKTSFEFPYMWDPYTGERLGKDPFGSLWFDPNSLIHFFYKNRLNNLWDNETDESNGYYSGSWGDGLGCGDEMFIQSRGHFPERYLFRLPIIDCYLTNDHKESIITMGPKLTSDEIKQIEELAKLTGNSYKQMFGKNRPSLQTIKKLYDVAIDPTPDISAIMDDDKNYTVSELNELYYKTNMDAVNHLRQISG